MTKQYMEDNEIFADAFNFLIYNGKQELQPEDLRPLDSVAAENMKTSGKSISLRKGARDQLKYVASRTDEKAAYLILGIEAQTKVHYSMPIRNMMYDAMEYSRQIRQIAADHRKMKDYIDHSSGEYLSGFYKSDCLIPVITLVISFQDEIWDGPLSLHDMLKTQDNNILRLINDYQIHLIQPAALGEDDLAKFHSNLREVLSYIKYSGNDEQLERLVFDNPRFMMLDRLAAQVINICTNSKIEIDEKEERINMCQAIKQMMEKAKKTGIDQGVERGVERMQQLIRRITEDGKADQLSRLSDPVFLEEMYQRYHV